MTTFKSPASSKKSPSILIVDDELDFANTISDILFAKGYQTLVASSGWEAMSLLEQTTPDVVLVDLQLPDTNGINLLPEIKKSAPNAEVVILTGHATLETAIQALHQGAFGYLRKPCSTDRLFLTLENALLRQQNTNNSPTALGELLFHSALPAFTFDPEDGTILNFNPAFFKLTENTTLPAANHNLIFLLKDSEQQLNSYLAALKTTNSATRFVKFTSGNLTRYYRLLAFLTPKNPNRALGVLFDITDQYEAELATQRRSEYFQSIWENLATGVAIIDSEYTILQVNPWFARFYGTAPDTLIGKKCHTVFHGFSRPCHHYGETCPIVNVLASGTTFRMNHRHQKPDGTVCYIEITVAPLHDENNTIVAFLIIHNDFTPIKLAQDELEEKTRELAELNDELRTQTEELKKANFELLRLSTAKDEFISIVSHELRTPLTVIAEVLNLLLDGSAGALSEKQNQLIAVANRNCSRLTGLINDLLDMSKLEVGKINVNPTRFDICALVEEVKKSLLPAAAEKGLTLETTTPAAPVMVYADEKHIHRVLINLVGNAIKFTEQGEVTITVEQMENEALISVIDTGIGIPESEQSCIFDKFYQARHCTGLRVPGTGLGLAITKKLLELNHSTIGLESKPNAGSRFYFLLPLIKSDQSIEENKEVNDGSNN
ncbi:response regulator [candidate division WOR-3 bacterium]|nr:response regulator [candidate division WOR-3 bacterium]